MQLMTAAMFVLFAGQGMDHWHVLAGRWSVENQALVCHEGPARLRSCYEGDMFELTFRYKLTDSDTKARLHLHTGLEGQGASAEAPVVHITPQGLQFEPCARDSRASSGAGSPAWLSARILVGPRSVLARTYGMQGEMVSESTHSFKNPGRGFMTFAADSPGLRLRDIVVREPAFTPLFDGQTLSGWQLADSDQGYDSWQVTDGELRSTESAMGWLRTLDQYDDFVLRLEYRLPKEGNSGVFVRAPSQGNIFLGGAEIQLIDDLGWPTKLKPWQHTGSIYARVPAGAIAPAPAEQWNTIEIVCTGRRVRTIVNGVQLYDVELPQTQEPLGTHSSDVPPYAYGRKGYIGLQYHSYPCRFRHIRIRPGAGDPPPSGLDPATVN